MEIFKYPSLQAELRIEKITKRTLFFQKQEIKNVSDIIENIRNNGDKALIDYVNRFDSPYLSISSLKVSDDEFEEAFINIDKSFFDTLNKAIYQIESFHKLQMTKSWINTERKGTLLGQLVNPIDKAGIYVPGGKSGSTPLVSTVLMCAIPAKIAGVRKIIMATPSKQDGKINPYLLVTAKKVGVDEIYKVGSAWAIAALAYGTNTVPKADIIVGPGNIYVTLAKKIVSGTVGIDMIAGPSEILVIADETADSRYIAADLLSQAEHDKMASSVLITTEKDIAESVKNDLEMQMNSLNRKETAIESIRDYGAVFIVENIDKAFDLANRIAPEHLELHIKDPFYHIGQIKNAGAVFLGKYTPEPVGDYIAGPNHVLPTAGTAKFASALSVDHFIKKTSIISYSKEAFEKESSDIIRLAEIEGLDAHANSIRIRLDNLKA